MFIWHNLPECTFFLFFVIQTRKNIMIIDESVINNRITPPVDQAIIKWFSASGT